MADRWGEAIHAYETVASAAAALADAYAQRSVAQRRAALTDQDSFPQGGHWYEHVSEYVTVVTLMGSVNVYTAPILRQLLVDLVDHGRMILVLDMTEICFFDSTGSGVLIGALKRVRAHDGGLALVVPSERIQKLFRINGLTQVFPIFDTVDRAVEFLGRELGAHG
ncbi:STAS domain-containing protein [Streptomyces sp. NBC_01231]|nr:STAS domain-containing protein [Streptomyces sp. NBC_01231]